MDLIERDSDPNRFETEPNFHAQQEVSPRPEQIADDDSLSYLGAVAWKAVEATGKAPEDTYVKEYDPESGSLEVKVHSKLTAEDYESVCSPEEWQMLTRVAEDLKGKSITFVNATAAGGGVAIMRSPLVHLMQTLGIDAHWYALSPNEAGSKVTKNKFHNVLQGVQQPGEILTDKDIADYETWITHDAELLEVPLRNADVIAIDDWQPSHLIKYIRGYTEVKDGELMYHEGFNPTAPILFRDHIHTLGDKMVEPGTPQHRTWSYLWQHIKKADAFITHPRDEFVPPNVPRDKTWFMPATIDKRDGLNRDLTDEEVEHGLFFINKKLQKHNNQPPIDPERPYIALVARFDESKGMPQGMESYAKAVAEMRSRNIPESEIPQLVIIGNGSVDDPSGPKMLKHIMDLRETTYQEIMDDIKVARVPHNDVAINAVMRGAKLALQPSTAEGFESRVTDAIFLGVPVIGSNRGGIPLQIVEGESGHILDPNATDEWAEKIVDLMTDHESYAQMRITTKEAWNKCNFKYTTAMNAIRWMLLAKATLDEQDNSDGARLAGNRRWPEELAVSA